MKDLLPHYETELALLRRLCRGFAEQYPGIAGNLLMSGDTCKDPHVERLIQASALLAARISKRLDDDYPLFTESLLEMLYPHYLRSFPSCSIMHLDFRSAASDQPDITTLLPRGTELKSAPVRGVKCRFRTTADIEVAPVTLAAARYHPIVNAPASIRLDGEVTSSMELSFEGAGRAALPEIALGRLRLFIDAEPSLGAALRDTLFTRLQSAYVSFDGAPWLPLRRQLVGAAGFAQRDALLPFSARSHPAYRLLTEYFAFPEKFNFFDLAWDEIAALMPATCRRLTLHLALKDIPHGGHLAQILAKLSDQHLLLNCAPVVNLFHRPGAPVDVRHTTTDYALLADTAKPEAYEIHGIESARLITDVSRPEGIEQIRPFYSMHHGEHPQPPGHYWVLRRDPLTAELSPGHEMRISLVNTELVPLAASGKTQTLSVELLCSNRDLPTMLRIGQAEGDLMLDGQFTRTPIRLLRKPSRPYRFDAANGGHWRLISHLTLNHRSLSDVGLDEFREMLTLYNLPRSASVQRQIQGVTALRYRTTMAWIPGEPSGALMPGLEIGVTVDEDAFVGGGVHVFAQTLDHFFGLYCQINVFSQLVVVSNKTGEELLRCQPRSGTNLLD
ncbi:type VI secretion system protein ImpG [Duganella sp. 1411]|jgi:type VI secretion system protein ImpG|uniref:type VI secretion system baseplate subunit TssF n=1 Tax=Duganella sp. 1411 TaxID=2806572 RepID=UPI001AE98C2E|nr:type VI secretion system baseplate subunit TssF [Duganella sp. 1411]MBP1207341.1 type VI secretion system protein ImpG [Duganella sp. 1411]